MKIRSPIVRKRTRLEIIPLIDIMFLSFPELFTVLSNRHQLNTNVPVYLSGSRDATHGSVMYVLDFVKRAGIQQVAVAIKANPAHPAEQP